MVCIMIDSLCNYKLTGDLLRVHTTKSNQRELSHVYLLTGVKSKRHYKDQFEEDPGFHFMKHVSRPE